MKKLLILFSITAFLITSCASTKNKTVTKDTTSKTKDTIRIANDELEYEIIIIEPGFDSWFASRSKPKSFYSQSYLEAKNIFWVQSYNSRVRQPNRYDVNIYEQEIDYQQGIDYGLEVNYMLYNYFLFLQDNYNQKL